MKRSDDDGGVEDQTKAPHFVGVFICKKKMREKHKAKCRGITRA